MGCSPKINGGGTPLAVVAADLAEVLREQSVLDLLTCLLKEQRRTNAYLALMLETQISDPEIEQ